MAHHTIETMKTLRHHAVNHGYWGGFRGDPGWIAKY
jgi:hypothetical protein